MAEAIKEYNYNKTKYKLQNNKKTLAKEKKKSHFGLKMFYLLFFVVLIALAMLILSNYQKITSLDAKINEIDDIIIESEKKQSDLDAKLEEIKSERDIVNEAQTKLGMVFPEKDQIVYFTLNESETTKENEGTISKVFSTITGRE